MLTWQPDSLVEKATYVLKLSAQQLGATGEESTLAGLMSTPDHHVDHLVEPWRRCCWL